MTHIDASVLPVGSIVASESAVAIKRYDRMNNEDYWMPAEGYPLPLSNRAMQSRTETDSTYIVLRVGSGSGANHAS